MKRKLVLSALLIWKIGTCFSAREIESKPYAVFDSSGKEMEQLIHSFSGELVYRIRNYTNRRLTEGRERPRARNVEAGSR